MPRQVNSANKTLLPETINGKGMTGGKTQSGGKDSSTSIRSNFLSTAGTRRKKEEEGA